MHHVETIRLLIIFNDELLDSDKYCYDVYVSDMCHNDLGDSHYRLIGMLLANARAVRLDKSTSSRMVRMLARDLKWHKACRG